MRRHLTDRSLCLGVAIAITCLLGLPQDAKCARPSFWPLESDVLGVGVSYTSDAVDVSSDGRSVLASIGHQSVRAAIWTLPELAFHNLSYVGDNFAASSISADGSQFLAHSVYADDRREAALWGTSGQKVVLSPLAVGQGVAGQQILSDGRGAVGAVFVIGTNNIQAAIWDHQGVGKSLNELSGIDIPSNAVAASIDASVIVGDAGGEAALWDADRKLSILGKLPGDFVSVAFSVSADGTVVVGTSLGDANRVTPFRWTEERGLTSLGRYEDAIATIANDINANGKSIVGMNRFSNGEDRAIIMMGGGQWRYLADVLISDYGLADALQGWKLANAKSISADGRTIVGFGFSPEGYNRGWVATIPEPQSWELFTPGILLLSYLAWARRRRSVAHQEDV